MDEVRVAPERLRRRFDSSLLGFETTELREEPAGFIGQPRALEAIAFGLEVSAGGYNVFATGPAGTGRRTMIEDFLRKHAAERTSPGDWVHLFDFDAEDRPLAVQMPRGLGRQLATDMRNLVEECRHQIARAFEGEAYHRRRQGIAVTGSVNQHGMIQPVGAINEKVEGFFDACRRNGLSAENGVIIPAANLRHLMLREDVVDAVRQGEFNIWAIETVDQGIEILTGVPAGEPGRDGAYPEGTINGRADRRLERMAETARRFQRPGEKGDEDGEAG